MKRIKSAAENILYHPSYMQYIPHHCRLLNPQPPPLSLPSKPSKHTDDEIDAAPAFFPPYSTITTIVVWDNKLSVNFGVEVISESNQACAVLAPPLSQQIYYMSIMRVWGRGEAWVQTRGAGPRGDPMELLAAGRGVISLWWAIGQAQDWGDGRCLQRFITAGSSCVVLPSAEFPPKVHSLNGHNSASI